MKIKKPASVQAPTKKTLKIKKPSNMMEVRSPCLYPVLGLATLSDTRLRYNPKTKGLVAFVTSTADGVDVAWDMCATCHLYIDICRCPKGSHPPAYLKHFDGSLKMIDMGDALVPSSMIQQVQKEAEKKQVKNGYKFEPAKKGKEAPDKPYVPPKKETGRVMSPKPLQKPSEPVKGSGGRRPDVVANAEVKRLKIKRPKGPEVDLDTLDTGRLDNEAEKAAKDATDMFRKTLKVKKPKGKK